MGSNWPIVMSVAGLDPCGGAGLLADIKTFERHQVYGLGVTTSQTLQTHDTFYAIRWETDEAILEAIDKLLLHYEVKAVKFGIVRNVDSLYKLISAIRTKRKEMKIILDPVVRSTTDFNFWEKGVDRDLLTKVLPLLDLITPNWNEANELMQSQDARSAAEAMAQYCSVLLKGGHNILEPGVDYLFTEREVVRLVPGETTIFQKHGSGCVLSSSITANIAKGYELVTACRRAKLFTEKFLLSNPTLLGYHVS